LPQLRQSSPPTKNKSQRANVALLTLLWLAVTAAGTWSISAATAHVSAREQLQTNADSVALVAASRGDAIARTFASRLSVQLISLQHVESVVTVVVRKADLVATASALGAP
jgi:hypothetical protein